MKNQKKKILVLNGGSSSLKFALYDNDLQLLLSGIFEQIGAKSFVKYSFKAEDQKEYLEIKNHKQALQILNTILVQLKLDARLIKNIVYRVVHGGDKKSQAYLINQKLLKDIEDLSEVAPLHNPIALEIIKASKNIFKQQKHWAVFDTGFYSNLPDKAKIYAMPYNLYKNHNIQRYGFHGISHAYILEKTAKTLKKKVEGLNIISCHLGSGASITAIKNGQAIDTSMGFTPLEGLVMSTRCGNIDPSLPLFLQEKFNLSVEEVKYMLNNSSGWYGISGVKDMRDILCASGFEVKGYACKSKEFTDKEQKRCKLALDIFLYNLTKYIGSYSLILRKLDAIVLTGGIGERSQIVYKLLKDNLEPLLKNNVELLQISTNEELMMAKYVKEFNKKL